MKKTRKPRQEDMQAFYEEVKHIKPLSHNKVRLKKKILPTSIKYTQEETREYFNFLTKEIEQPIDSEGTIEYKQESISHKILRKLKKGQYNIAAKLDLHGMTIENARVALDRFLVQCLNEHLRVALVIHGKGSSSKMPILKNQLHCWLQQTDKVLAFCSATPRDGGRGAVYVLLKQHGEITR